MTVEAQSIEDARGRPILAVESVAKYYGNGDTITKALRGISFEVARGEFTAIMGASGSGKSTLLNAIATIDTITTGHVVIDGQDVSTLRPAELAAYRARRLGFVFQDFNLLDTMTAFENIALALTIAREPARTIGPRVKAVAGELGIADLLDRFPRQLSGGQRQRVACARAVINEPALVLADEPTGSLDSRSARMLLEVMTDLNRRLGTTILMVTHDPFTASWCDRILFVKDGTIFTELRKGGNDREQFFADIIRVVATMGAVA